MNKLLDRLMARQRRLLDKLDDDRIDTAAATPPTAQERKERGEREAAAVMQADIELLEGRWADARALLVPFAEAATLVRTLTVLGRIESMQGRASEALQLLKRAHELDPMDRKVWRLLAEALASQGDHLQEVRYRRQLAFVGASAPAQCFVDLVRALRRSVTDPSKVPAKELRLASERISKAPDLTPEVQAHFAESVFAFTGMSRVALDHYARALPCGDADRDVTATWTRMFDWCERSGSPLARWLEGGAPARRPAVADLRDVLVSPRFQWVPVLDEGRVALIGHLMQRIQLRTEDPETPLLMYNKQEARLRLPREVPTFDEPAVLVGGMPRYYHNTVEFLSALAIVDKLDKGRDLPIVVNDDLAPFQIEQLEALGYPADRLIRIKGGDLVRFRLLTVPSRLVQGGRWIDPLVPAWYRRRLGLDRTDRKPSLRLYLSSKAADAAEVANEDEATSVLSQHGYKVVNTDELSFREQVELFSQASHIVAATGAALTNMLFAPPGASIVTMFSSPLASGSGDRYFDALAKACGHRFSALSCDPVSLREGERTADAAMVADPTALLEAIV